MDRNPATHDLFSAPGAVTATPSTRRPSWLPSLPPVGPAALSRPAPASQAAKRTTLDEAPFVPHFPSYPTVFSDDIDVLRRVLDRLRDLDPAPRPTGTAPGRKLPTGRQPRRAHPGHPPDRPDRPRAGDRRAISDSKRPDAACPPPPP